MGEGYDYSILHIFLPLHVMKVVFFVHCKQPFEKTSFSLGLFRIVGRAAFTGNHQWILSSNYSKYAHPPEVYIT